MLSKEAARAVIEKLASYVKHYGTAVVSGGERGVTRFANSEINQNVSISDAEVSLTLYDGKREATCSANMLTDEGLKKLANDAEAILPYVPEGEFGAFPASREVIEERPYDNSLSEKFGAEERAATIKRGVDALPPGFTGSGALTLSKNAFAFGDTDGAFRYAAYDFAEFNTVVTHRDGAAGSGDCAAYAPETPDVTAAFEKAARTAEMARNPVSVDTGAYTVVLSPQAFCDLIYYAAAPLSAKWFEDGRSYAIGRIGERVFGGNVSFRDDVTFPGTRPLFFDCEGNRRRVVQYVENGVLKNILYDNKTAARKGAASTGQAVSNKGWAGYPCNLVVDGGGQSLDEIIASTENGIFINEFHYTNFVNPRALQVTGLIRNGTFLIENGKLGRAITTMRFTQNLIDSLNSVTALSKERAKVAASGDSVFVVPAARIEGFHFTSKS